MKIRPFSGLVSHVRGITRVWDLLGVDPWLLGHISLYSYDGVVNHVLNVDESEDPVLHRAETSTRTGSPVPEGKKNLVKPPFCMAHLLNNRFTAKNTQHKDMMIL